MLEKPSLEVALMIRLLIYSFHFRSVFQPTLLLSRLMITCVRCMHADNVFPPVYFLLWP